MFRSLLDAASGAALLIVAGTLATPDMRPRDPPVARVEEEVKVVDPPRPVPEPEPAPVAVAQKTRPRIGYTPPEEMPSEAPPPAPAPMSQEDNPAMRPYERDPIVIAPKCMPTRSEVMQYWRSDLVRAKSMSKHCTENCMRKTLGDSFYPLMRAVQNGANGGNNTPEPPEAYTQLIVARHCQNGSCKTRGFEPMPSERRR